MVIRARAPLRLGLAGGGSDVSPYCDKYGGIVLNATIDRYAYATIKLNSAKLVRFTASDLGISEELTTQDLGRSDGMLKLHEAVYHFMVNNYNDGKPLYLELSTFCDAPAGSGLGSSSTLVVAMIKAFSELLNIGLDDYQLANTAYYIEREICKLKGGKQDQYAAAFGGFNFIEFYEDKTIVNPLRIKDSIICELEASILLYYTGVSRESAKIISDQSKNMSQGSEKALEAMHGIKQEAVTMKENLLKGNFTGLVESMILGWENKKQSSNSVSTPLIEDAIATSISLGALSAKVSGAGGGGFIMFFVPSEFRINVKNGLESLGGVVSNCHFTHKGSQSWVQQ